MAYVVGRRSPIRKIWGRVGQGSSPGIHSTGGFGGDIRLPQTGRKGRLHVTDLFRIAALIATLALAACAAAPDPVPEVTRTQAPQVAPAAAISDLAAAIRKLGPDVDPAEADRVARIAMEYPLQLVVDWNVTDGPLVHNMKVNAGLRPAGLCYQWADAMQARLAQEDLQTLTLHRAIANSENPLLIQHSTVIVSRRGVDMFAGIILDPWRDSGDLFWAPVTEDKRYKWIPRAVVFESRAEREARRAT